MDECIPAPRTTESHLEDQEIAGYISIFLHSQSKENRIMFLQRYWFGDSLSAIALKFGCTESRVKSSLHRTRKALRRYLEDKGVTL